MPWIVNDDLTATEVGYVNGGLALDLKPGDEHKPWFGSLAGAVLHGGVQATAFDKALRAEPVYDGVKALAAGLGALPEPIGVVSDYRVVVLDGELQHPPLHPSECHFRAVLNARGRAPEPEEDFCP